MPSAQIVHLCVCHQAKRAACDGALFWFGVVLVYTQLCCCLFMFRGELCQQPVLCETPVPKHSAAGGNGCKCCALLRPGTAADCCAAGVCVWSDCTVVTLVYTVCAAGHLAFRLVRFVFGGWVEAGPNAQARYMPPSEQCVHVSHCSRMGICGWESMLSRCECLLHACQHVHCCKLMIPRSS